MVNFHFMFYLLGRKYKQGFFADVGIKHNYKTINIFKLGGGIAQLVSRPPLNPGALVRIPVGT